MSILKKKYKSEFLKSVFTLAVGSIVAQLLVVIASPFITRLYSPAEIGMYTYFLSSSQIFIAVINGRYDMSIVMEKEEERIFPLIKLSYYICLIFSAIISFTYYIYLSEFSDKYAQYYYMAPLIFILLFSYGIINILTAYNNHYKEYKLISSVYVVRTACQNIGTVVFGFFKMGMFGLFFPYIVGQLVGIKRQAKSLMPHLQEIRNVNKSEMFKVLKAHYRQPLFSVPALLANSFSYSSVTLFIEALFGLSAVGFYSISVRILGLPLAIVSGNVSKAFFEEASREYNEKGNFKNAFKKTSMFLLFMSFPIVFIMIVFAPSLCSLVFGANWEIAGQYLRILAPMFGIKLIVTALSPGLLIARKQNYELGLNLLLVFATGSSFVLAKVFAISIKMFLMLISVSMSLVYIACFLVIAILANKNIK